MKRIITAVAIIASLLAAFAAGRQDGINHAMTDSTFFITDAMYVNGSHVIDETCYEPGELPSDSDFRIWTFLDGQAYENFGFIG